MAEKINDKEMLQQGLDSYNAKVAKATAKFPERPHMDAKQRLYTPLDIEGFNYLEKDGFPGQYPFTRGVQPTMYRGRLWTMRAYAGLRLQKKPTPATNICFRQGRPAFPWLWTCRPRSDWILMLNCLMAK